MAFKSSPKVRTNNIILQELKGELLLYDRKVNKAFLLNETSAMIWNMCDGQTSVSEITERLSRNLRSSISEDVVWFALEGFRKEQLIENEQSVPQPFQGMSRRDVIRKVGLASVIALPVIFSVVAPTAAHAQSCQGAGTVPRGGACTLSCQCIQFPGNPSVCVGGICTGRTQA